MRSKHAMIGAAHAYFLGTRMGVCPCSTGPDVDDPGPRHIAVCPFVDDDYSGPGRWELGAFDRALAEFSKAAATENVIDVHDMSTDGSGPWRLIVNGYGVASFPLGSAAASNPKAYAEEVARVLRKGLSVREPGLLANLERMEATRPDPRIHGTRDEWAARAGRKQVEAINARAEAKTAGEAAAAAILRAASLRAAIVACGRHAGALLSDDVSDETLLHVPTEVRLRLAKARADCDEWKRSAQERFTLLSRIDGLLLDAGVQDGAEGVEALIRERDAANRLADGLMTSAFVPPGAPTPTRWIAVVQFDGEAGTREVPCAATFNSADVADVAVGMTPFYTTPRGEVTPLAPAYSVGAVKPRGVILSTFVRRDGRPVPR